MNKNFKKWKQIFSTCWFFQLSGKPGFHPCSSPLQHDEHAFPLFFIYLYRATIFLKNIPIQVYFSFSHFQITLSFVNQCNSATLNIWLELLLSRSTGISSKANLFFFFYIVNHILLKILQPFKSSRYENF